ncbi:hypothetical protein PENSPDRAFT_658254 [Peniophora sp. CONT]|nr:hypothetical protein PENSPDRAFT_658254 [Peniophora sp. CONT]
MPSVTYDLGWAWFKDRLLAKVVLAGGRVNTELLSLVISVKTVQSQVWGTVKKQADGTIFPESYLELETYCPSVIVEIVSSENSSELMVDKQWWLNFAKQSVHGKLMLLMLIDVNAAKRRMVVRFYTTPDLNEDTSRTLDLSLDDPIPDSARLVFLPEWLYGAVTPPEWIQGKSIIMDHEDLDQWRRLVRTSLYAT